MVSMSRQVRAAATTAALLGLACAPLAGQAGEGNAPSSELPPSGTQMVFVNTQAILPEVPGAREAQETWQEELQQYQAEVQRLRVEVDSLVAAYRQQEAMLSPEAREERQQEIVGKQQELQQRAAELERQAGQRQQELLAPILERVGEVIEAVRRERDYTIVFDIASSGVVAADPSLDITPLVLERIRGAETAAEASPPGR